LLLCSGLPLRLVEAIFSSSFSLIDEAIDFDGPLSLLFGVSPRLADSAAPAAFCWAADLAGISRLPFQDARMKRSSSAKASSSGNCRRTLAELGRCGVDRADETAILRQARAAFRGFMVCVCICILPPSHSTSPDQRRRSDR